MKTNQLIGNRVFFFIFLILMFTGFSVILKAQVPTNFSGKWQFDKSKSILDKIEPDYDGTVILEIIQDTAIITFAEIYIHPGREDWKTANDSFKLDGKEQIRYSINSGTHKNSTKWSPDKKVLTISNTVIQTLEGVLKEFIVIDSYQLSDNGKTLTIERYRNNPVTGENKARKVYYKK